MEIGTSSVGVSVLREDPYPFVVFRFGSTRAGEALGVNQDRSIEIERTYV